MNNVQQTARVGLFFLLGLALTWVTFETLSGGKVFKDKGYTLIAGFDSLKELKTGDEVRMAGVKIGSVEKTRLAGRRAEAVLRIEPEVKIASDATASIVMAGLIGTNYVGLDLGSAGAAPLADGAEIHTKVTPDINTIMTEIGNLGQKLEGALSSFGTSLNGDGKGGGLFQKLDKLVTENTVRVDTTLAKGFVTDAQGIIAQVKSGKGALGALVYDETAANDLRTTVANLRAVSDKLAKGEGTLGKLINDDTLFNSAQSTLKKADRALDGLGDSGPITAVGIVAKSLF
jgi:phospholipid/cholesterol/gamma-HCH transport system substrate-binding protein